MATVLGGSVAYFITSKNRSSRDTTAEKAETHQLVIEAKSRAKEIIIEAKDNALKTRTHAEEELQRIRNQANKIEKQIAVKKADLEADRREIQNKMKSLKSATDSLKGKQKHVEGLKKKTEEELQRVTNLSREEARQMLLDSMEKDLVEEKGRRLREVEEEVKLTADAKAQELIVEAMGFGATDIVVEHTTSKVKLPDEDLKGRIIGKEGRNIRAFEEKTGVELDMDSSPGMVIISSFDSVRRELARLALERLLKDGRIQPARIEEIVEKTQKELNQVMFKAGSDFCHKLGVYNLPKELVQILGRYKYRFSYGQNLFEHTLEMCRIGTHIASELKAAVNTVKMGCLLHDIGKVITDKDGSHVELGVELLKKYKISSKVIACVEEHHDDTQSSVESGIVALSDHISGARPGARGEDYESYIKRLKALEEAALSFDGVEKAYAVSAGREVRIFVSPEKVDDYSTAYLAKEIAKKIELEQNYPGTVKITVIRETRVIETAK